MAKQTTQQKRAKQNRAQRAALDARKKAAAVPLEKRQAAVSTAAAAAATDASGPKKKGDRPARAPRPPAPGSTPVDIATLEGSWYAKRLKVPGGKEVLLSGFITILVTGMTSFTKLFVPKGSAKGAKPTETIFQVYGGKAILFLAAPILVALAANVFSLHPRRRTIWNLCALIMAVYVVRGPAGALYLFPVGTLLWATFKASRVEGPAPRLFRRSRGVDASPVQEEGGE